MRRNFLRSAGYNRVMTKLVLFDIDGTLLHTQGAGMRAMERAGAALYGHGFTFEGISYAGKLDPMIYLEAARLNGVQDGHTRLEAFEKHYCAELRRELRDGPAGVRALPGIVDLLEALEQDPRVALGMVTGNYCRTAPVKMGAVGLTPSLFRFNGFGDEAEDRPALVRLAMHRYTRHTGERIAPRDVIVIGDTPRDVHCAHANGCLCLAVATGRHCVEELQEAGAEVIVEDLSDPAPLWSLIANAHDATACP